MISPSSIVVATPQQASTDLPEETVILNLDSGVYYGLERVGATIWTLLQRPRTVGEVRDAVINEYEVPPDRCERDLVALLQKLAAIGLVEVRNEATS